MGSLGIAIDGGRFVRIESSTGGLYRTVRLRTLNAGQNSAKLDFCSFGRKGLTVRKSVVLKGLVRNKELPSELRLRVERRGYALWIINARKPDGTSVDIRVRTGIGIWPLIAVFLLILLFGLWLLLRTGPAAGDPPAQSSIAAPAASGSETAEVEPDEAPTDEPAEPPAIGTADEQADQPADSTAESPGGVAGEETAGGNADIPIPDFPRETILRFRPESAALSDTAIADLDRLAELIPENISMEIAGHCAIFGTERGRDSLSRARAAAVHEYLSGRIPPSVHVEVRGYGGTQPLTRDMNLQDLNRRVEIKMIGENN